VFTSQGPRWDLGKCQRFRWKSKLPQWLKPSHLRGPIMYGLKPVPFKDGCLVASRVALFRVRSCWCSPARDAGCDLGKCQRFRWNSELPQWLKPSHLRGPIMYGLKPVPFKDGCLAASRVALFRVWSCWCSPARGRGLQFGQIKKAASFLAAF
jgi:hypothetical protein